MEDISSNTCWHFDENLSVSHAESIDWKHSEHIVPKKRKECIAIDKVLFKNFR